MPGEKISRKSRIRAVIDYFQDVMPEPETELSYENPYELIVSVILSAQCTDKRVNLITPALFRKYPDPISWPTPHRKKCLNSSEVVHIQIIKPNISVEWPGY